ncbi:MAG: hypothetical protein LAN84_10550 [Acidobacteriia bacterium]|nr:hypothetical protein [Terriglobia bacterium]
MNKLQTALRDLRIIHGVMLVSVLLYMLVIFQIHPSEGHLSPVIPEAITVCCAAEIAVALVLRARLLAPCMETLRSNPDDAQALGRWREGNLVSITLAQSVALFGLVLKFLGASWFVGGPFFATAIFLLLIWTPRIDLPSQT